jgi:hypothetical protein
MKTNSEEAKHHKPSLSYTACFAFIALGFGCIVLGYETY